MRLSTGASRVLMLSSSNGGTVPNIGTKTWVSVLHESVDDSYTSVIDFKRRADESHINILNDVWSKGSMWLNVEDLGEKSSVRAKYESDGTKVVYFFMCAFDPSKETFFGTVEFSFVPPLDDPVLTEALKNYTDRIRKRFEKSGYKRIH